MCNRSVICIATLLLQSLVSLTATAAENVAAPKDALFLIPKRSDIAVDGNLADWKEDGFLIQSLVCAGGTPWPKATPPANVRLAWDDDGLVIGVTVHQKKVKEHDYVRHLFKGDSVEVFLSTKKGSHDRYMLIVSPGLDPKFPNLRHCFFADPAEDNERSLDGLTYTAARQPTEDGYTMELKLPWSNLRLEGVSGLELGLQIYVMETDDAGKCHAAMWHPAGESHIDENAVQRVMLSEKNSPPMTAIATLQESKTTGIYALHVIGLEEFAGKQFQIATSEGLLFGMLERKGCQAYAEMELHRAPRRISIGRQSVPLVSLTPGDQLTQIFTDKLIVGLRQCVVQGSQSPEAFLTGATGFRIVSTKFFDSQYREVPVPKEPGRYGAVIEFADKDNRTMRRFRTFFVAPSTMSGWSAETSGLSELPPSVARDPDAIAASSEIPGKPLDLGWLLRDSAVANPETATLCAYVWEKKIAGAAWHASDFRLADRQWWVGLKRKLYGWDIQFPDPLVAPLQLEGKPAPVLRQGTLVEAGFKASAVERLDQLCQTAEDESHDPITLCVARHGVIVFHKAYGTVGGKPMTVDTPCGMSSATKPLSGALMMIAVSQGKVKLDDRIDKFARPFKNIPVPQPLTIRHLYTHMNGLRGVWGDQMHDTEEVVAGYYAILPVGVYSYNSVGFALGGKVLEAVSGEAFPQFAKKHLLIPLQMTHTEMTLSADAARSTALDYAKFAQMLLNHGTYGDMRFFSEDAYQAMLPTKGWGPHSGVGFFTSDEPILGSGTFGHDAGNSCRLWVSPKKDLVIALTSAGDRKGFGHTSDMLQVIVHGIADGPDESEAK